MVLSPYHEQWKHAQSFAASGSCSFEASGRAANPAVRKEILTAWLAGDVDIYPDTQSAAILKIESV